MELDVHAHAGQQFRLGQIQQWPDQRDSFYRPPTATAISSPPTPFSPPAPRNSRRKNNSTWSSGMMRQNDDGWIFDRFAVWARNSCRNFRAAISIETFFLYAQKAFTSARPTVTGNFICLAHPYGPAVHPRRWPARAIEMIEVRHLEASTGFSLPAREEPAAKPSNPRHPRLPPTPSFPSEATAGMPSPDRGAEGIHSCSPLCYWIHDKTEVKCGPPLPRVLWLTAGAVWKKNCSTRGARIFGFWRGFGEGVGSRATL